MEAKNTFILILKTKQFLIPSEFPRLLDVNPKIYEELITNKQYHVKSNVTDEVFQNFINNWVNDDILNTDFSNILQYKLLSEEFDRFTDCIQLYVQNVSNIASISKKIQQKQRDIKKKLQIFQNEQDQYQMIIKNLRNNQIKSYLSLKNDQLLTACQEGNIKSVLILSSEKVVINGLSYTIIKHNKEAFLDKSISAIGDIYIPKHINHNGEDHLITEILRDAFKNCDKINSIQFPNDSNLLNIESFAFSGSSITSICIPSSVTSIESNCFADCKNLRKVEFMANSKLKYIGSCAFNKTSIVNIIIPSHVRIIKSGTFMCCRSLQKVEFSIDSELQIIEDDAFSFSTVEELVIPSSAGSIAEGWIADALNLMKVTLIQNGISNLTYLSNSKVVINSSNAIIFAPRDIEEFVIPSFIEEIGENAFCNCKLLKKISFESNSKLKRISRLAFYETGLKQITIPSSVIMIGDCAFYGSRNFSEMTFCEDSKLFSIGMKVFTSSNLKKLTIPSSIVQFAPDWSCNTPYLNDITLIPREEQNIIYYNKKLILGKSHLLNETYDTLILIRRDVKSIQIPSFIKYIFPYSFCESMTKSVTFSDDSELLSFGRSCFAYSLIKEIVVPSSVTEICDYVFSDCCLKRIFFKDDSELEIIGDNAFSCSQIQSISIPRSVKLIDREAFCDCTCLEIIEIQENSELDSFDMGIFEEPTNPIIMIPADFQGFINDE